MYETGCFALIFARVDLSRGMGREIQLGDPVRQMCSWRGGCVVVVVVVEICGRGGVVDVPCYPREIEAVGMCVAGEGGMCAVNGRRRGRLRQRRQTE